MKRSRVLIAALAVPLAASVLACNLGQVTNVLNAAQTLGQFSERLQKGQTLTYTASYQVVGQSATVNLAQKPPNSTVFTDSSRLIFTTDYTYSCTTSAGAVTCQRSAVVNSGSTDSSSDSDAIAAVAGQGFVSPELALGLIIAASVVPGASVSTSNQTIAGQSSLCATVSGLESAAADGSTDAPKDFSVCVTDSGVLASFTGTSDSGETQGLTLLTYAESADDSLFAPPAGATVTDVDSIIPTATPN